MNPTTQRPILVLGATGKTGRRVVQRLEAKSTVLLSVFDIIRLESAASVGSKR